MTVTDPTFEIVIEEEWIALLGIEGDKDGYVYICFY